MAIFNGGAIYVCDAEWTGFSSKQENDVIKTVHQITPRKLDRPLQQLQTGEDRVSLLPIEFPFFLVVYMFQTQRLAILAAALFFVKFCPVETWALSRMLPKHRGTNTRGRRRRAADTAPPTPPAPDACASPTVILIASRRPPQPGEFGSHYCQSGRFRQQHKSGRRGCSAVPERVRGDGAEGSAWAAAVAALAASGNILAYQSARPSTVGEREIGREGGKADENDKQSMRQERSSGRKRSSFENCQRQSTSLHGRHAKVHYKEDETKVLAGLRAHSPANAITGARDERHRRRHKRQRTPPLRLKAKATTPTPQEKLHPQQIPLLFFQPFRLLNRVQTDARTTTSALSVWTATRTVQVTEAVGGAIVSVSRSARSAQAGVGQWAHRRVTELCGLRAEAGRYAENAVAAVKAARFGSDVAGKLLDIRKRVRRRDAGDSVDGGDEEEGEYEGSRLTLLMDQTVQNIMDVVGRDGWEHVATTRGVVVYRQYIALGPDGVPVPPSTSDIHPQTVSAGAAGQGTVRGGGRNMEEVIKAESGGDASVKTPQFACVKATAILDVPADVVYRLFEDNSRVSEYNEHCKEVMDLETLSPGCKITWAASGRMGPFKARDFCTIVHFRTLSDGTLAQVSRPVEHPAAPRSNRYVRSEILLAGNFMRPVPGDPSRTEFLMITHVNPGGAAETRAGAMLVNSLCVNSPVNFIRRLEIAAQKLMWELQEADGRVEVPKVGEAGEEEGRNGGACPPFLAPPPPVTADPPDRISEREERREQEGDSIRGEGQGESRLDLPEGAPEPPRLSDVASGGFFSDVSEGEYYGSGTSDIGEDA